MAGDYLIGFFFVVLFVYKVQSQSLPERFTNVSACYSDPNGIGASCTLGEMIAVDAVYAGAKLIVTSCMSDSSIVNLTSPTCCVRDEVSDCITHFVNQYGILTYRYHEACTGQEVCGSIPVQWMPVTSELCSDHTNYRDDTGYLAIDYYCIKNTSVGVLPDVSLSSGSDSALYLQGQQYPGYMANATDARCSMEVTCGEGISIQAIHIKFDSVNGVCQQEVTISDLSGQTKVITCDDNNNYNISEIYSTSSHYVTLNISNLQGNAQFWMGFIPTSGGGLNLSCPAVPRLVDTLCTTTSTTPIVITSTTTAVNSNTLNQEADTGGVQSQSLPERFTNVSACYSDPNGIGASCTSGEMIAVDAVYAGAKLIVTSCMSDSSIVNLTSPTCCVRDEVSDCITHFVNQYGNLTYRYHEACTGQESCGSIPVQWMPVTSELCSDHTSYRDDTGYLAIDYYCIKNTSVGVLPDASLSSGSDSALYLQGQQYPGYMANATDASCSMEVTCGEGIIIQAIHIKFDSVNGVCQQDVTISDLSGHTKVITCDDNNNYNITEIYSTSSHYVTLNISSLQGNAQFWMGFIPTSGGGLNLSCPAVPRLVDTLCTTTSTTPIVITSTTTAVNSNTLNQEADTGGVQSQSLPERFTNVSACYSDPNGIGASCTSGEMIAVDAVYAGAKLIVTSCMSDSSIVNLTSPTCCVRDEVSDCITHFVNQYGNLTYRYHEACTGQESCGSIPVQWMPVTSELCSDHTSYRDDTGYLAIDYYCIKNTSVGVLPDASLSSGSDSALYLQGQQYPGYMANATDASCSMEVTCGEGIIIQAIHIKFDSVNGVCQQDVTISDLSGHTKVITCDDNNNYNITEIYSTSSHYVTLNISSLQGNAQFWMGFIPTSGGGLNLSCPAVPRLVDTLCTTTSTTPIVITSTTTAVNSNTLNQEADTGGVQSQSLPERFTNVSACYSDPKGIGASCTSGEMIAIDVVYAGAKLISTSCMSDSAIVNRTNPTCCVRDEVSDCITHFVNQYGNLTYRYHEACTGQEVCGSIPVQWMPVTSEQCSDHTNYRDDTGYLAIDYYCIKNTSVGVLPDVSLSSGSDSALYLQGQQYPGYMANATDASCSMEVTCGEGISIHAIHIEFDRVGGFCQQEVTISDLSGHTKVITCDDNNNYNITEIYSTSSHYVILNISSQQGNAQFWMGFIPTSGGGLNLSCPAVPRLVDTLCTTTSTTPIVITSTTTAVNSNTLNQEADTGGVQLQSLPERFTNVSACYSDPKGIGASCTPGEMIAVDAVYAGAKLISTSCMSDSSIVNLTSPTCCVRDEVSDCIIHFVNQYGNLTYRYHEACTGQEVCGSIPVQWMPVTSELCMDHTNYRDDTGYLAIDYYCIKNTSVGVLPDVSLSSGSDSALYLQGQQYPGYMANATYASCSMEVTCGEGINIQAIHIEFDRVDGFCQQEVTISDLSGHTKVITCDDNNNYTITKIYSTSSHYVILNISSQQGNAQFWMGFIPTSGGGLNLSCPAVPRLVDTLCTTTSTTPIVITSTTTAVNSNTLNQEADTGGGSQTIIIAVVAVVLLLIIIVVVALLLRWKYRKQKNAKVAPEKVKNMNQDAANDSDHFVTDSVPIANSTAPWATAVIGPPRQTLPPITSQANEVSEQDGQKKKKKKKKKRKKRKKKERSNVDVTAFAAEEIGKDNE